MPSLISVNFPPTQPLLWPTNKNLKIMSSSSSSPFLSPAVLVLLCLFIILLTRASSKTCQTDYLSSLSRLQKPAMDDSLSSLSKTKPKIGPVVEEDNDSPEESGWSIYFEDFVSNNQNNNNNNDEEEEEAGQQLDIITSFSSACNNEGSSLVSDAAFSSAENKCFVHAQNDQVEGHPLSEKYNTFKKLSFKKRRKGTLVGDDLEDTASSPINSPKVSPMSQYGMSMSTTYKETSDILDQERKRATLQMDEKREGGVVGVDNNNSNSELKKKGLCLVPLSMLMNYMG